MKIGAGGLQSMLTHDAVAARKVDPAQARIAQVEEQAMLGRQVMPLEDLIRMVEHMNRLAEMNNYPYRFRIREKKEREKQRPQVALVNREGRYQRYLTDDEALRAAADMDAGAGAATTQSGLGLDFEA